jgi:hypothetical protein
MGMQLGSTRMVCSSRQDKLCLSKLIIEELKIAVPAMLREVNAEQFWEALKSLKSLESESVDRRILELVFGLKKLEESNELMGRLSFSFAWVLLTITDFISHIADLQRPSTTDGAGNKLSELRGKDEQNGA